MKNLTKNIQVNEAAFSAINNSKLKAVFYPTFGDADLIFNDNGNLEKFTLNRENQKQYADNNDWLILDKKLEFAYYGETRNNPYPVEFLK